MQTLRNYFYTLKNLKLIQIFNRVSRRFRLVNLQAAPVRVVDPESAWHPACFNAQSWYPTDNSFEFLNHRVSSPPWNDPEQNKLWLYNLHYFDDLNAANAGDRKAEHAALISRWVAENPAALGNAWEPYPLSLRIVNWLKWQLAGNALGESGLESLGLQCHVLMQSLEYHLLGNHLFANAKALVFAGVCLQGEATNAWQKKGEAILLKELDEQFLADGANFELSPMYHGILLVDCLDLLNLASVYPGRVNPRLLVKLQTLVPKALRWLLAMSHNDGEISFFNDATLGIAWENADIFAYAQNLGFDLADKNGLQDLAPSGFVSLKNSEFSLIADLAEIGPRYIPGHAHADTLSFEWCLHGQRVLVNSGISEYGISAERLRQRQTPAHNTVSVNGMHSTEVWSGFRVARRAHILDRNVSQTNSSVSFSASHDGFKRQGLNCIHQREFCVEKNLITIIDELVGEFEEGRACFNLHPDVTVKLHSSELAELYAKGQMVKVEIQGGSLQTEATSYHPGFGLSIPTERLVARFESNRLQTSITW